MTLISCLLEHVLSLIVQMWMSVATPALVHRAVQTHWGALSAAAGRGIDCQAKLSALVRRLATGTTVMLLAPPIFLPSSVPLLNLFIPDINECLERTDNCEQFCTNTEDGFECSCLATAFDSVGPSCTGGKLVL